MLLSAFSFLIRAVFPDCYHSFIIYAWHLRWLSVAQFSSFSGVRFAITAPKVNSAMKHDGGNGKKGGKRRIHDEPYENSSSTMKLNLINYVARVYSSSSFMHPDLLRHFYMLCTKSTTRLYRLNYSSLQIYNRHSLFGFIQTPHSRASLQHVNHKKVGVDSWWNLWCEEVLSIFILRLRLAELLSGVCDVTESRHDYKSPKIAQQLPSIKRNWKMLTTAIRMKVKQPLTQFRVHQPKVDQGIEL